MKIISDKLKVFFLNKTVFIIFCIITFINLSFIYILYRYVDFSRDSHVLHYNFYFGIDLLGNATTLRYVPVVGYGIFLLNFLLAFWVYKKKQNFFLSNFILFISLFINIELFIYLLGIISIEY